MCARATIEAFNEDFMAVNPVGVACGKNDEQFKTAITQGYEYNKAIGTVSMKINSLNVTILDDYHALMKVNWISRYRRDDGSEATIPFDNIYLVRVVNDKPKIFAYITGEEKQALREHGILFE